LGPILQFDGATDDLWRFRITLLARSEPVVQVVEGGTVSRMAVLADFESVQRGKLWQGAAEAPRVAGGSVFRYAVQSVGTFDVSVPPKGGLPRVTFASCGGWSEPAAMQAIARPDGLIEHLLEADDDPDREFPHLFVGGGDQVYADSLWHGQDAELHDFAASSKASQDAKRPAPRRRTRLLRAWIDIYRRAWWGREGGSYKRTKPMADVLARVPGLYTWDDHEIMDGWGSLPPAMMQNPVVQDAGWAAATTFRAFQLGVDPTEDRPHHFQAVSLGDGVEIVMLDTRWQRRMDQILAEDQWRVFKDHLSSLRERYEGGPHHLLVVVAVPVVHARYPHTMNALLDSHELGDDLRDHWEHDSHLGERSRLVNVLLEHADTGRSVTLLSGDVHVASRAYIEDESGARVHQVTSSGIVHPAPKWWAFLALQQLGDTKPRGGGGEPRTEFVDLTSRGPMLRARNYVDIGFDESLEAPAPGRMWIRWYGEVGDGTGKVAAIPQELVIPLRSRTRS
jgi:hypothetical protein